LWFSERNRRHFLACDGFEHCFEGGTQSSHPNAREVVGSRPNDVIVGEEDGRALVEGLGSGAQTAVLRHEEIEDDLLVAGPVATVCENEDGVDLDLVEVAQAGVIRFVLGQLPEGSRVLVVFDDVAWCHDVLEAVAFGDLSAFLAFATHDEDRLVLLGHFTHGRVAADELAGRHFHFELAAEVQAALFFCLASAVGDEDVGAVWGQQGYPVISWTASTLMPHSFWPLRIFIASMAAGMGFPPRIRTPSMSKANA
jgi:hypothetical protein